MNGPRVGLAAAPRVGLACGVGSDELWSGSPWLLLPLWGQSNDLGIALASALSDQSFAATFPNATIRERLATAADPIVWVDTPETALAPHLWAGNPSIGVEASLFRDLDANAPHKWRGHKVGVGSTRLGDEWLPNATWPTTPSNLYTQATTDLDAYIASTGYVIAGFIWIQGEHDAQFTFSAQYAANLATLVAALRARYGNFPFFYNQLHINNPYAYRDTVRAQQVLAAATLPWSTFLLVDDLTLVADNLHFDANLGYVPLGQRYAAAVIAARNTTTITADLADSADPLSTPSGAYSYTLVVANTGAVAAVGVSAVVTIPATSAYVSSSGTGWTIGVAGQVVTCTRASMAIGAAPTITINCTAPASIGTGSISCGATVVASNVMVTVTDTEVTTLNFPSVTVDAGSSWKTPASGTEWDSAIAAAGVTGANAGGPANLYLLQEPSGTTLTDVISGTTLTLSGSGVLFVQTVAGWARKALTTLDGNAHKFFTTGSGNNPSTSSVLDCLIVRMPVSNPGTSRAVCSEAVNVALYATLTSGILTGQGVTGYVSVNDMCDGAVHIIWLQYDRTHSVAALYTELEKKVGAYGAGATNATTFGIGAFGGANAGDVGYLHVSRFFGAAAEKSSAQLKAITEYIIGTSVSWS